MSLPPNQENKEKEEINNYDEFKQIKKSGIQRRQKLSQIKQSGLQNSNSYQPQVSMNQKEKEQKEETIMNQQNNAKNKIQMESSVFQIDTPLNFETIQQELLNISSTNKSTMISERKFKQPGIIILDKQLLDKATPLIQQYVGINLETSDPTLNEQVQKQIKQYSESLKEQLDLSDNIYSKIKKNDQVSNKNNNFLNQKNEDALLNKSQEQKQQEQNETQNNSSISLLTPYQNFFSRQEEDIRQKLMDRFLEKNQVKQPERKQDMNFYQDSLEDQNQDTKRKSDPLVKQFDFFQLNQNKHQKQTQQVFNKWKPVKNFSNQDSQIDQYGQSDFSETFIDKIKDMPDQMMREDDLSIYVHGAPPKNKVDGLLLPQMYLGNTLKLPEQLQKDYYETYLGGPINYSSPQQKLQNEMIFNQISPLAREAARNISYQVEDQFIMGRKQENFVTPKPKNLIFLGDDPQISPEEINFETILNIVGDGIGPEQLNKIAAQQDVSSIQKDNQNSYQQHESSKEYGNSKEYGTLAKNNTSIEIANFKNMLHQSNQNITNQNTNNLNYSISSRINNTNYYEEQPIQDISNNVVDQHAVNKNEQEKSEKHVSHQSVQYANDINDNQTTDDDNNNNHQYREILNQEITDFKIENLKQPQIQQQQQQYEQQQQQYVQQQQQQLELNQNKRISIRSNNSLEMQKMEIQQVLNDIKQLQKQRKNIKLSQVAQNNLLDILKARLNDLMEFVKYDEEGNDIFGDVTTQKFFDEFPQNVEKIKYQTICGFQKLRLLYVYFENYLPLLEENMNSEQSDHLQSKSSPEVLMKNNEQNYKNMNKTIPNTTRSFNYNNNRNENNYQKSSKSPYAKKDVNQTLSPSNKYQNYQQQNRVLAGKPKQNQMNELKLQTAKQPFNKDKRNTDLAIQMKTARSNNLDRSGISNINKSYSINQTTQMYSPVSKKSNQSMKNVGFSGNKTFSYLQSPTQSYLNKTNTISNKNVSSNNINRNAKNTIQAQQQNRSLSNKKTQGYLNSARTPTNLKQNRIEDQQLTFKKQSKLNKSEDFTQKKFFNNNLNNNNYEQNFDYQDNYGENQFDYNLQQRAMMMMNRNNFNHYDNYSYEDQ